MNIIYSATLDCALKTTSSGTHWLGSEFREYSKLLQTQFYSKRSRRTWSGLKCISSRDIFLVKNLQKGNVKRKIYNRTNFLSSFSLPKFVVHIVSKQKHRKALLSRNRIPAIIQLSLHCCDWCPNHYCYAKKFVKKQNFFVKRVLWILFYFLLLIFVK